LLGTLAFFLVASTPAIASEPGGSRAAVPEDLADAWEHFQRALQEWAGRLRDRFSARDSREDRPLITQMLNNKDRLGLSADQVRRLEQLRDGFQRQSIRHEADLRIVEIDIAALLDNDPVDMAKLEAKIREGEKLRTDLRLARIRAIEQAKAQLNAEQKRKLQELIAEPRAQRPQRGTLNPPAKDRE
jgi:Spy/CpxP family protein refolding chaperone